jgi:glucose-6-phosphate isomerase
MGGSSLAPEVFSLVFPAPGPPRQRLFVLDSTDPASVLGVERAVKLPQTLFIVASKSGKTIETLSQFRYFHNAVAYAGVTPPGQNFVAITDAGSYLEELAREHKFRRTFLNPADIGGRYSAISFFGLMPAALWGVKLDEALAAGAAMKQSCGAATAADANPALTLGALLGAGAQQGVNKLFLLSTPSLASLGCWIEQLVAESTGKEGKGVVPVAGEVAGPAELFADGAVAALTLDGEDRTALDVLLESLEGREVPVADIRLATREELAGEFYKWELATAVTGVTLQINPFDEPNVQESKDNTGRILDEFARTRIIPVGVPRLAEGEIGLYVDGVARNRIFTREIAAALRTFFTDRQPGDYLSILAYLDRSAENTRRLEALRLLLRDRLKMPVLLGFGPRLLHSIGQLYKGGPSQGMFLQLTAADPEDAAIPGADYTFGQLKMAQALGDMQSLVKRDKPAVRLHMKGGATAGLPHVQAMIEAALKA